MTALLHPNSDSVYSSPVHVSRHFGPIQISMKYIGAKTPDERWLNLNVAHEPTGLLHSTTTTLCGEQPELSQSDVIPAPIHQLPDDVLCNIFTMCCQENSNLVRLPYNRNNVAEQITISRVCSTWRHVILNIPSLWNDFEVFMDDAKDGETLTAILCDWLSRAKGLPRSLALNFGVDDSTLDVLREEHWYRSIVTRLIASFQFRKLTTSLSNSHWVQFLQLPAEKLSCIEELHIRCINPPPLSNFGNLPSQTPLDNFKKLTSLTSLQVDQCVRKAFRYVVYSEDSIFMHIPWHQLRYIHLTIPTSISFCFSILKHTSMVLETCDFVVANRYPSDLQSLKSLKSLYTKPLYCPQLRTLKLVSNSLTRIFDPILLWTEMPNLKTLRLVASDDWGYNLYLSALVSMRELSNMQLEHLFLYKCGVTDNVEDLLALFPSLKQVGLSGSAYSLHDDTIDRLGTGHLAPCLEELTIECFEINLGKFLPMVKLRSNIDKNNEWEGDKPTRLRYVRILRWIEGPEEYGNTIEEINRCGVQLIVETK